MKINALTFLLVFSSFLSSFGIPPSINNHIKVDQFGYRPNDEKIAVISNPQTGFNAASTFAPGTAANQYEIRNWSDDVPVYTGTLVAWNSGTTHAQSGDKVWWFDFSSLTTPGTYYVFDVTNNVGSYQFDIRDDVYSDVMRLAVKSYYYQRCGCDKASPHAGTGYTDLICHAGTQQDTDCRLYNNTSVSTSKNLSGGWHDAGDYNKYVNFSWEAVINLLLAYEENPTVWGDDYNYSESGNGVSDLLDEVKYELDWLLRMQNSDGSVLSVVGGGSASPPSSDNAFRTYGPATTSASYSASAMFALGAIVYKSVGMTEYSSTLQTAAVNAWNWASANPGVKFFNSNLIAAGENELSTNTTSYNYELTMRKLSAASFLFNLTGNTSYQTFFDANYSQARLISSSFAYPFETIIQDALLYYSKSGAATVSVVNAIKNKFSTSILTGNSDNLPSYNNKTDAYRAYLSNANHTWGSNAVKCKQGVMLLSEDYYNLSPTNSAKLNNAASGYLHYIHGINPLALVYISNMNAHGAENSVKEFYNGWFSDGSALWDRVGTSTYGPAPGFIPAGPNASWGLDPCCPSGCGSAANNAKCVAQQPPGGQPILKSFKDWNTSWPQNSWSVTENGIYYNAAYIRLLSKFMPTGVFYSVYTPIQNLQTKKPFTVTASPNPFDQHTTLEVHSQEKEKIQVRVFSALGKELMAFKEFFTNEPFELGEELMEGIMIIEIKNQNSISTLKLIKN